MSSPMRPLVQIGHREHPIDRKRYGAPYLALYWAGHRHTHRGLWLWTGRRNLRVLAMNHFLHWFARA